MLKNEINTLLNTVEALRVEEVENLTPQEVELIICYCYESGDDVYMLTPDFNGEPLYIRRTEYQGDYYETAEQIFEQARRWYENIIQYKDNYLDIVYTRLMVDLADRCIQGRRLA